MLDAAEVVEGEDQVRGYAMAKDRFVIVDDGELAGIALEAL
jgi:non-homologous end joining protein Ku